MLTAAAIDDDGGDGDRHADGLSVAAAVMLPTPPPILGVRVFCVCSALLSLTLSCVEQLVCRGLVRVAAANSAANSAVARGHLCLSASPWSPL